MIEYAPHADQGYVELTLDGKIDREGFEEVVDQLGPLMEKHGKIGILKHILSFRGMSPTVLWEDLKFAFRHLKHVGPVAVVSDKRYIAVWTKLARPLWSGEVRFFEENQLEEARAWIAAQMAEAKSGVKV